jgi:pantothenate kinase
VLEQRLLDRWRSFGFDETTARAKVSGNDLPNVDHVLLCSARADIIAASAPNHVPNSTILASSPTALST